MLQENTSADFSDEDTQVEEEIKCCVLHTLAMTLYRLKLEQPEHTDDLGYELCKYWM